jgi:alanine racemase
LRALAGNFRGLQQHVGEDVSVCAVIKANAYGHGTVRCAQTLAAEGAQWLGVTGTEEGVVLRDAGLRARILLMTGCWQGEEDDVVERGLTPVIWDDAHLGRLERAAEKRATSVAVHIKVDTGMARLGVSERCLPALLERVRAARHVTLEGVCSHLASSEVLDAPEVPAQAQRFREVVQAVRRAGFDPKLLHLANTAAVAARPDCWWNMVRPGLALYGYCLPLTRLAEPPGGHLTLEPVLSWKTRVLALRSLPAGQRVGYSGDFVTQVQSRLAILPVGYADGLSRRLSGRGRVIVRGAYAPIVGRISMDLTFVDVTQLPGVEVGDEVVLIGRSGGLAIDAAEHARLAQTISYQTLCSIAARVSRKYVE